LTNYKQFQIPIEISVQKRPRARARSEVKKAATKLKQKRVKLLKPEKPVKVRVTFQKTHFADAAELLPNAKRVDGLKVEYSSSSMVEAYKTFELLVFASAGVTAILEG